MTLIQRFSNNVGPYKMYGIKLYTNFHFLELLFVQFFHSGAIVEDNETKITKVGLQKTSVGASATAKSYHDKKKNIILYFQFFVLKKRKKWKLINFKSLVAIDGLTNRLEIDTALNYNIPAPVHRYGSSGFTSLKKCPSIINTSSDILTFSKKKISIQIQKLILIKENGVYGHGNSGNKERQCKIHFYIKSYTIIIILINKNLYNKKYHSLCKHKNGTLSLLVRPDIKCSFISITEIKYLFCLQPHENIVLQSRQITIFSGFAFKRTKASVVSFTKRCLFSVDRFITSFESIQFRSSRCTHVGSNIIIIKKEDY
ncbi:hypothetical protein AGLY_007872 [Aphis glycines]|uniref:Uncharacterized protein n=1 Tax=Aphis glycines TaxID=307491 RepID=A0A6G0TNP7_APHGL|nr:hypothetical protein AGLY_007872 [Aphis glycines]